MSTEKIEGENLTLILEDLVEIYILNMNDLFSPGGDALELCSHNYQVIKDNWDRGEEYLLYAIHAIKSDYTRFTFFQRRCDLGKLYKAMDVIYDLIKNKKIDTFDWNSSINKKLHYFGLIPEEDKLIDWFHSEGDG